MPVLLLVASRAPMIVASVVGAVAVGGSGAILFGVDFGAVVGSLSVPSASRFARLVAAPEMRRPPARAFRIAP